MMGWEMAIVGIYFRFLGCTPPKTYWVLTSMEYPSRDIVHFKHEFNQPLPIHKTNTAPESKLPKGNESSSNYQF